MGNTPSFPSSPSLPASLSPVPHGEPRVETERDVYCNLARSRCTKESREPAALSRVWGGGGKEGGEGGRGALGRETATTITTIAYLN